MKNIIRSRDVSTGWYNHFMTTQEVFFNEGKTIFPELGSAECINCRKKKMYFPFIDGQNFLGDTS